MSLAKVGALKLFFLELDGIKLAASLCFDYKDSYFLYNSGYDLRFAFAERRPHAEDALPS